MSLGRVIAVWVALTWAADAPSPAVDAAAGRVVQLRVDAAPIAPELASMCVRLRLTCPSHGGPRTQTGAAFPVEGGLLTNAHVVAGARRVQVVDGEHTSEVDLASLRVDPDRDLAFLPVPDTAPLPWHAGALREGQAAWSVGYPDDGPKDVLATTVHGPTTWAFAGRPPQALVRVAGPVHPGDSGGPLLSPGGELTGVVVAGSTPDSALAGDGLVIPAATARPVAEALARTWDPSRRLGVVLTPANDGKGAWVVGSVRPGSPAEAAGLHAADVVERVDGDPVTPASVARRAWLGTTQVWSVRRGESRRELRLQAVAGPTPPIATQAPLTLGEDGLYSLSLP